MVVPVVLARDRAPIRIIKPRQHDGLLNPELTAQQVRRQWRFEFVARACRDPDTPTSRKQHSNPPST